jgi:hypothetical protein
MQILVEHPRESREREPVPAVGAGEGFADAFGAEPQTQGRIAQDHEVVVEVQVLVPGDGRVDEPDCDEQPDRESSAPQRTSPSTGHREPRVQLT